MKTAKRPRGGARSRRRTQQGLAREYRFDYDKSRPNRFAGEVDSDTVVVVLDADVAKVFRDSKGVNALLRATIAAVKRPPKRKAG